MDKLFFSFSIIVFISLCACVHAASYKTNTNTFKVEFLRTRDLLKDTVCEITYVGNAEKNRYVREGSVVVDVREAVHHHETHNNDNNNEEQDTPHTMYLFKLYGYDKGEVTGSLEKYCPIIIHSPSLSIEQTFADEVIPIIQSGSPANRIDVVFMGDGYTTAERDEFFSDMKRLTNDMWSGSTFASYLPLFNVWALYRPSAQSGIGVGGVPRDTAFGLYRDGTELRGVYTSKASTARAACVATGFCDFPSLIGNDLFYGGLGGEFTISTSSPTSGTIVLRHEFGHNFGQVGEEYNGGSAYFGANIATSATSIGWPEWLTNKTSRVVQSSAQRIQSYAWYNLANGARSFPFTSDGLYSRALLKFSVSGCESPNSLSVALDGKELLWNSTGILDRQFYDFFFDTPLSEGSHTLVFKGTPPVVDQIRQLCNVEFLEYADEQFYKTDNTYIGIYPTVASNGRVYYRSNNELCLMRNMSSPQFCDVCKENMWLQFLSKVSLIEEVDVDVREDDVYVDLNTLKLAQFRTAPIDGEKFSVTWTQNGVEQTALKDLFEWHNTRNTAAGTWVVRVVFQTLEVRKDPNSFLTDSLQFAI